jgi:peptide/nickel transport system ATP-binding protein
VGTTGRPRMSLLEISHLSVGYAGRDVLRNVSLSILPGEIVALVGPSGSGKSTLAHAVIGLLPDDAHHSGSIHLSGQALAELDEDGWSDLRGARIGMVFQEPATALNPAHTIGAQIAEVLARHTPLGRAERRNAVDNLLKRVGLDLAPGRHPHSLSGGQRQRVAVAMAIAAGPHLLIADEPTAALDPLAQAGVMDLLAAEARSRGTGLLLVSHDLALVSRIADRIIVLEQGRVVEEGAAAALLAAPRSAYLSRAVAAAGAQGAPVSLAPDAPMLAEADVVSRQYRHGGLFGGTGQRALDGVTLTLHRGETLALVGASGSGKSTLARLLLGLDHADGGAVTLAGQAWSGARGSALRRMRRRVQAVLQDPGGSFDPRWTVERIVAEPLRLMEQAYSPAERIARVIEALGHVGLDPDAATRLPAQFSGGQRQRIGLARALITRPDLIILDEALSALDPPLRADMVALLRRLQAELGMAYLFVSHDLALVRGLAHRVMVLRDGHVVEEGATEDVLSAPRDPYTAALVAATPHL